MLKAEYVGPGPIGIMAYCPSKAAAEAPRIVTNCPLYKGRGAKREQTTGVAFEHDLTATKLPRTVFRSTRWNVVVSAALCRYTLCVALFRKKLLSIVAGHVAFENMTAPL